VSGFFLFQVLHGAVNNLSTSQMVGLVFWREVQIAQLDLLSAFCGSQFSIGKCSLSAVDGIGLCHRLGDFWQSGSGLRERIAAKQLVFNFETNRVNQNRQNNPWQNTNHHSENQLPNSSSNNRANCCCNLGGLPDCQAKRSSFSGGGGQARQAGYRRRARLILFAKR
jgi:hypothetical protein